MLPKQDFKNLVPFEKNFYVEGPEVQAMSEQEVTVYRARREITVEGRDVPKPVRFFHEANFPGTIKPSFPYKSYDRCLNTMYCVFKRLPLSQSGCKHDQFVHCRSPDSIMRNPDLHGYIMEMGQSWKIYL